MKARKKQKINSQSGNAAEVAGQIGQIIKSVEDRAKRIAYLLYFSTLEDEERFSWLAAMEKMDAKQLDRLEEALEERFLREATADIDEKYSAKLKDALEDFHRKEGGNDRRFLEEAEALNLKKS